MATNNEKNIQYWSQRTAERRLINSENVGSKAIKDVVKLYEQSLRNINDMINSIYVNYSKRVGLSVDELSMILNGTERANFFKSIQANMIKLGFNVDQIYNERYIYRLSRLDALKQQIYWEIASIAPQETTITGKSYIDIIDQTYRDAIESRKLAFGNSITPSFHTLNKDVIKGLLQDSWQGKNYSERIWDNVGVLGSRVQAVIGGVFDKNQRYMIQDVLPQTIGGALTMGQSYQKTARMLRDLFDVGTYNATRLVRTEGNYFENQAELESMVEDGIEKYEFYAVMDKRTSRICQEHDGEVVNVEDAQVGKNYPPLHPNCRSTAMPLLKGEKKFKRLRPNAWKKTVEEDPLKDNTNTKSVNERWKEAMAKQMNPNKQVHDFNADLNRITREYKGKELIDQLGKLVVQVPDSDPLKPAILNTAKLMGWSDNTSTQILGASGKQISLNPEQQAGLDAFKKRQEDAVIRNYKYILKRDMERDLLNNQVEKGWITKESFDRQIQGLSITPEIEAKIKEAKQKMEEVKSMTYDKYQQIKADRVATFETNMKQLDVHGAVLNDWEKNLIGEMDITFNPNTVRMGARTNAHWKENDMVIEFAKRSAEGDRKPMFFHEFGHAISSSKAEGGFVRQVDGFDVVFGKKKLEHTDVFVKWAKENQGEVLQVLKRRLDEKNWGKLSIEDVKKVFAGDSVFANGKNRSLVRSYRRYAKGNDEVFAEAYSMYRTGNRTDAPNLFKYFDEITQ